MEVECHRDPVAYPNGMFARLIILGNLGWVLGSIAILILPIGAPTAIGYGFVILQALGVLGIATFEYRTIAQHSLSPAA